MRPYSEDLRWRVVVAVVSGMPREDVAMRFAVSISTITRWLRQQRTTGDLALMPALPARLAERADTTLQEQCRWWQDSSGVQVSTATMSRALTRLGWTRKKSR